MEKLQFSSNESLEVGEEVSFHYLLDEDGDPVGWMGIKDRLPDPSKKFYYEAEVLSSQYIGRWGDVRTCTKCRIISRR